MGLEEASDRIVAVASARARETAAAEEKSWRAERGDEADRLLGQQILPQRIFVVSIEASSERSEDGSPASYDAVFEILLNDDTTAFRVPVHVTYDDALTRGFFAEDEPMRSADFLYKAWCQLGRFGRALSEIVESSHPSPHDIDTDTPLERWWCGSVPE